MEKLKRIISGEEVQSSSDESEELKEDGENQLEAVAMETEPAEEQVAINQQLVGCVLQYIFHVNLKYARKEVCITYYYISKMYSTDRRRKPGKIPVFDDSLFG